MVSHELFLQLPIFGAFYCLHLFFWPLLSNAHGFLSANGWQRTLLSLSLCFNLDFIYLLKVQKAVHWHSKISYSSRMIMGFLPQLELHLALLFCHGKADTNWPKISSKKNVLPNIRKYTKLNIHFGKSRSWISPLDMLQIYFKRKKREGKKWTKKNP